MTERRILTESLAERDEFGQTWAIAQCAFIEESCTTQNSVDAYQRDLTGFRQFLKEKGVKTWQEITSEDLADFFERKQTKSHQNYSPASRRRQVVVIRSFFNWLDANTQYPISIQTIEAIRSMRKNTQDKRRDTAKALLSRSELINIAANPNRRDQALIHLLISGITPGQLEKLTIGNIQGDPQEPVRPLEIEVPKMKGRMQQSVTLTLNDEEADSALRRYLLERKDDLSNLAEPLFPSRQAIWMMVTKWGKKIGIPCTPRQIIKSARLAK